MIEKANFVHDQQPSICTNSLQWHLFVLLFIPFLSASGKNPFADPTCQPHEVGTYEVTVRWANLQQQEGALMSYLILLFFCLRPQYVDLKIYVNANYSFLIYGRCDWSFNRSYGFANEIVVPVKTNDSSVSGIFPMVSEWHNHPISRIVEDHGLAR